MSRMRKFWAAVLAAMLTAAVPLAALSFNLSLRDGISGETGIAPAEAGSEILTGYFSGTVPGRTALVFDLANSLVLLGERDGPAHFSALCWQLDSWREVQALALSFLPRYEEYAGSGTLAAAFADSSGVLVIRSPEEAAALPLLSDSPLWHDQEQLSEPDSGIRSVDYRVYIGNRNTKVFHDPSCPSVAEMKEKNKIPFAAREDAAAAGYRPCRRCNP